MQVSLSHAEVQAAVVALLVKRGVSVEGQDIAVSFTMGRKNTSLVASVVIDDPEVKTLPAAQTQETSPVDEVATPVASSVPAEAYAEAQKTDLDSDKESSTVSQKTSVDSPTQTTEPETPKSLFSN